MSADKWDHRFLHLARLVSTWSRDPSTQTGTVIVRPNRTILSVGFNGFPRGMSDASEFYANRETKYSRIVHSEMNALIHAETSVKNCTLYTWPFMCCDRCVVHMIQAGISRFVFPEASLEARLRWGPAFVKAESYLNEVGIPFKEIPLEYFS